VENVFGWQGTRFGESLANLASNTIIMWDPYKKGYKAYLQLEKSLSENSVSAYLHDVAMLTEFLQASGKLVHPKEVVLKDLQNF
jgi:site-specific recombinase XerD